MHIYVYIYTHKYMKQANDLTSKCEMYEQIMKKVNKQKKNECID